jgi:dTDP-4-dehydrorhamnose reductase/dTDP-4-dehydrorhamnose 3,5-epimerase
MPRKKKGNKKGPNRHKALTNAAPTTPQVGGFPIPIKGAFIIQCPRYGDERGFFQEIYNEDKYTEVDSEQAPGGWKQVSWSGSAPNVIRGIHTSKYAKMVTCVQGSMLDCIIDLREDSPTFLRWSFVPVSASEPTQILIPAGCGHGFLSSPAGSQVMYLQAGTFNPEAEEDINYADPCLGISWPVDDISEEHNDGNGPTLSEKDANAPTLAERRPHLASMLKLRAHLPRVFIIGASGQVGHALLGTFGRMNCVGTYSSNNCYPNDVMLPFDLGSAGANPTIAMRMLQMIRPKYVCICAGWTFVDGCEKDPERALYINAKGATAIAHACSLVGARVVYYSTEYVFDGTDENPGPYSEDPEVSAPAPVNAYGMSKLKGEEMVLGVNPDALIIRTTVVYGPERQGKNFVYQMARAVKSGNGMAIVDDQYSSPTYNKDLADITATLLMHGAKGIYNVVGPETMDRHTFGTRFATAMTIPTDKLIKTQTVQDPEKAKRPLKAGLDISKLTAFLSSLPPSASNEEVTALMADPRSSYSRILAPRTVEEAAKEWRSNPDPQQMPLGR